MELKCSKIHALTKKRVQNVNCHLDTDMSTMHVVIPKLINLKNKQNHLENCKKSHNHQVNEEKKMKIKTIIFF